MAALWGETFGHLRSAADLARKYDVAHSSLAISAGGGYLGGDAVTGTIDPYDAAAPWLLKRVAPATPSEGLMGYRAKATALPYLSGAIVMELSLWSGNERQMTVTTESDGRYTVHLGSFDGATLATTDQPVMVNNTWVFVEWRWKISPTAGQIELRVNNSIALLLTGLNTQGASNGSWDGFEWVPGLTEYHTDLYLLDRSGLRNTNFLGKGFHGLCGFPIADAGTAWLPNVGTDHYACVDETAPDYGATNVKSQVNGQTDRYQIAAFDASHRALFAQANHMIRKASSGIPNRFRPTVQIGGIDYPGTEQSVGLTAYKDQPEIREVNPVTVIPWTVDEINEARWGVTRTA